MPLLECKEAVPRRIAELLLKEGKDPGQAQTTDFLIRLGEVALAQPLVKGTWKTPLQPSVSKPSLL